MYVIYAQQKEGNPWLAFGHTCPEHTKAIARSIIFKGKANRVIIFDLQLNCMLPEENYFDHKGNPTKSVLFDFRKNDDPESNIFVRFYKWFIGLF